MKIAYITWATAPQLVSYNDFNHILDYYIYLPQIHKINLLNFSAIIIPDFTNVLLLKKHQIQINDYVSQGGFLIIFGANKVEEWFNLLPLKLQPIKTPDWKWWMKKNSRLEIYYPKPYHPITKIIPITDMSWHFEGVFQFIPNSFPILNLYNDKACLFFDFYFPLKGRVIITSLDPHTHHGRRYIPATSRFLNKFYSWLKKEVYNTNKTHTHI